MKHKLTLAERETTIRFDMETMEATIDSAIPSVIRQLDKLAEEYPETYQLIRDDPDYGAKKYKCPAKYIRFRKPASEARRAAARRNSRFSG